VADIIVQLAFGYYRKFGGTDGKFITDCIETAKPYFPKNNNLALYFMYSNLYAYELMQSMRRNGVDKIIDIVSNPSTNEAYKRWQQNELQISELGYQDQPKDMYQEMMKYHEFRGSVQSNKQFDGKRRRSVFIKSK